LAAKDEVDLAIIMEYLPKEMSREEIEKGEWFSPEKVTRWVIENPGDFASAFRLIWGKFSSRK